MGVNLVGFQERVASAKLNNVRGFAGMILVADRARRMRAVIVAESSDRFLRHKDYTPANPILPTQDDWEQFVDAISYPVPVLLATLCHPDEHGGKVRGFQTKRGTEARGAIPGRPSVPKPGHLKDRRIRMKAKVRRLLEEGQSLRQIEEKTGIPFSTVRSWRRDDA